MKKFIVEKKNGWANVGDDTTNTRRAAKSRYSHDRHEAYIDEAKVIKKDPSSRAGYSYYTIQAKYYMVAGRTSF